MANPFQSLYDVQDSGRAIQGWSVGRTFTDYEHDRQFRRAVGREFEIIGEALARNGREPTCLDLLIRFRLARQRSAPSLVPCPTRN